MVPGNHVPRPCQRGVRIVQRGSDRLIQKVRPWSAAIRSDTVRMPSKTELSLCRRRRCGVARRFRFAAMLHMLSSEPPKVGGRWPRIVFAEYANDGHGVPILFGTEARTTAASWSSALTSRHDDYERRHGGDHHTSGGRGGGSGRPCSSKSARGRCASGPGAGAWRARPWRHAAPGQPQQYTSRTS